MTNLARQNQGTSLQINTVEDLQKLSEVLAKSGFFEDAKSAAQCFVKILAGKELGLPAFSSMTGIHIVKGKPSIGANLMAAKVKASGRYDYRVKTLTGDLCEIEFFENKESLGVSSFSKKDAAEAGTQNMQKFARNMLFARAISNGVRFYCPDIFFGAPVYTPEELGAEVDGDGDVIDVSALTPVVEPQQEIADVKPAKSAVQNIVARICAAARDAGFSPEARDAFLRKSGYASKNDIPQDQVETVVSWLTTERADEWNQFVVSQQSTAEVT